MAELTDTQREEIVCAIAAAINHQSFDARANVSDLSMAEEIVYVTGAASAPNGLLATAESIVREHVTAALDEVELRISRWQVLAERAATYFVDPDQARISVLRGLAYRRAVRIVRDYRQEQDR